MARTLRDLHVRLRAELERRRPRPPAKSTQLTYAQVKALAERLRDNGPKMPWELPPWTTRPVVALPKIDVSRFSVQSLAVFTDSFWPGTLGINASIKVVDVDTGKPTNIHTQEALHPDADIAACAKKLIMKLLEHEVDECLFVDGKRANNPHPERPE